MEVHHHPHVEKKNFKEYFLEFLMIFLAVTMGFFAETIRESITEKKAVKEYAKLLVNDLAADTVEFNRTAHVLNRIITCGDSLSALITGSDIKNILGGKLYYYEYWSGWRWKVTPRDATLRQMENSGAFRYIGNVSLVKKILDYEESLKIIQLLEDNFSAEKTANWKLVQKVFDHRFFDALDNIKIASRDSSSEFSSGDTVLLMKFLNHNYPLLTYDKNTLMEISNWALNSSSSYKTLLITANVAKQKATEAIDALKKEYEF